MSKAYECDICKDFYTPEQAGYRKYGIAKIVFGKQTLMDICPECYKKLKVLIGDIEEKLNVLIGDIEEKEKEDENN